MTLGFNRKSMSIFLIIALAVPLAMAGNFGPSTTETKATLPGGTWTASTQPVWRADQDVNVISVTTSMTSDLIVESVKVENRSQLAVTGVRLGWAIAEVIETEAGPEFNILATGSTPYLKSKTLVTANTTKRNAAVLPARGADHFDFHIVRFGEFASRTFGTGVDLTGEFRIFVHVEEALFSDGSQNFRPMDDLVVYEAYAVNIGIGEETPIAARPCPKQRCKINSGDDGLFYTCTGAASDTWCEVKNQGQSCTNHICTDTVVAISN